MTKYIIKVEEVEPHIYEYDGMFDKLTLIYEVTAFSPERALAMHNILTNLYPHCRIITTLEVSLTKSYLSHKGKSNEV